MLEWLLAGILFWVTGALYFGGLQRDIQGGTGFRQFIGLVLTYAVFLVVWRVVYMAIGADTAKGILVASAVAMVAMPLEVRAGFAIVGGKVRRAAH